MTVAHLAGRSVVVTGAGGGVGRAVVRLFAREGARLVLNDLGCDREGVGASPEAADAAAAEARAAGAEAVASYDSVASPEGARAVVEAAVDAYGGVDAVVCLAGVARERSFLKPDDGSLDAVFDALARGAWNVARAAARRMVDQRRGGRIVLTTAAPGMHGAVGHAAWAAANAAVFGLTRALAVELRRHAVRVNALCPLAKTRLTDDLPMFGAIGEDKLGPAFVAPAALFLASELSGDLSGEVLAVAGNKLSTWRMAESRGVVGDDPRAPWAAEDVKARWDELSRHER